MSALISSPFAIGLLLFCELIGAEGTDSCGMQWQGGDPTGASAEEAPLTPRGKRVPVAEINSLLKPLFVVNNQKI